MWEIGHGQKTTLPAQNGQCSLSLSLQGFIIVYFVAFGRLASVSETDTLVPPLLCYSSFRHTQRCFSQFVVLCGKSYVTPMRLSVTSETTIRRAPSRKASNKAARLVRPIKEKSIVPCAPTLLEPPTCAPYEALMLPMLLLGKPILRACFATWDVDFQKENISNIFTQF